MNIDHLAISYDNKLFIPARVRVRVPCDGNCLFRALVESDFIPISNLKTFRSDLSIRIRRIPTYRLDPLCTLYY